MDSVTAEILARPVIDAVTPAQDFPLQLSALRR
jgi:hypothetical protein